MKTSNSCISATGQDIGIKQKVTWIISTTFFKRSFSMKIIFFFSPNPCHRRISRVYYYRIRYRAKCSAQIRDVDRPGEQGKYTMEITFVQSDFIRQALARIQSNFVPVVITPVVQHRESPRWACMYASSYVKWKRAGSWSRTALCHTCTVRIRIRYGSHMGRCVPEPGLIIFLHTSTGNFCREPAKNFEDDKLVW